MPGFSDLMKCIGKAVVKHAARALISMVPGGEAICDIAKDTYEEYYKDHGQHDLRAELEKLAAASVSDIRREAEAVATEQGAGLPSDVRQALQSYLGQVPSAIRASMRRPSDPSGKTVPVHRQLGKPDDLIPFLPASLPRFKAGDHPLAADWELVELLGKGGFGEVWKARHLTRTSQKPVALKFCLDPVAAHSLRHEAGLHDVIERVRQQGGAEGIVPLLETYLRADPPCLAYELIEGGDLGSYIQERTDGLSPPAATRIVRRLASIVAFAHRLNPPLVHRDLKPSNILVRRKDGGKIELFVADFGIGGLAAKQALHEHSRQPISRKRALPTVLKGAYTPVYASPQQVGGQFPDPRDDVHALGVIWYQLVTGNMHATSIPPEWREILEDRNLGKELIEIMAACITSGVEKRLASAVELAERLSRVGEEGERGLAISKMSGSEDKTSRPETPPLTPRNESSHGQQGRTSFNILCPTCKSQLTVYAEHLGQLVECPLCHNKLMVPKESAWPTSHNEMAGGSDVRGTLAPNPPADERREPIRPPVPPLPPRGASFDPYQSSNAEEHQTPEQLRKMLLEDMLNIRLRKRYLAVRTSALQEADKQGAFTDGLFLIILKLSLAFAGLALLPGACFVWALSMLGQVFLGSIVGTVSILIVGIRLVFIIWRVEIDREIDLRSDMGPLPWNRPFGESGEIKQYYLNESWGRMSDGRRSWWFMV